MIETRRLGNSDLHITPIGIGAWAIGGSGFGVSFVAILCINVLHISPWQVSQHLFAGAAHHLTTDGRLFIYGPFMKDAAHTAPSNAASRTNHAPGKVFPPRSSHPPIMAVPVAAIDRTKYEYDQNDWASKTVDPATPC